jgi:hypothetical protein
MLTCYVSKELVAEKTNAGQVVQNWVNLSKAVAADNRFCQQEGKYSRNSSFRESN